MEHSRVAIGGIFPKPGDTMVTGKRRPILTLVEDSSPGIHDTLIAACDRYRYELLGVPDHDNCADIFTRRWPGSGFGRPRPPHHGTCG